jgi:hypothetical protein
MAYRERLNIRAPDVDMGISVRVFGELVEWTWAAGGAKWRVLGHLRLWFWASGCANAAQAAGDGLILR